MRNEREHNAPQIDQSIIVLGIFSLTQQIICDKINIYETESTSTYFFLNAFDLYLTTEEWIGYTEIIRNNLFCFKPKSVFIYTCICVINS